MMGATITKLPTASTSFLTVRKSGNLWAVVLTTPNGAFPIYKTLCEFSDRDFAKLTGQNIAGRIKRPFKARGAAHE